MNWDTLFMEMVYLVAMKSKDNSTHLGAIIVSPSQEIRSFGFNGLARGLNDDVPERNERDEKYFWYEHAERNAIYNAGRMGVPIIGCKMYTNGTPCMDCGRAIIQSGIKEVIVDKNWDDNNINKWLEHAKRTRKMFLEAGIKLRQLDFKIEGINKYRRGKVILG